MIVSVWSKGKVHTTRVATIEVTALSATDVIIEGKDHSGAIVLALHVLPEEAREVVASVGRALAALAARTP